MTDIEFFEDTHEYLVNGIVTPSTTQLMHHMPEFMGMYDKVPKRVLMRKAAYGDRVHELIEALGENPNAQVEFDLKSFEGIAVRRFLSLALQHEIQVKSSEQLIAYIDDGMPLVAGKYDMLGEAEGKPALIDIKTTAKYDPQYLSIQLSAYKVCLEQMTQSEIPSLYCLWLPKKSLGRLIEVDYVPNILEKLRDAKAHIRQ